MRNCRTCEKTISKYNKYDYCFKCYTLSDARKIATKSIVAKRKKYLDKNNPNFKGKTYFTCKCGKVFQKRVSPSQINKNYHKYCSRECKHKFSISKTKIYMYKNCKFRSSWELELAKYFDNIGYSWVYEPQAFKTSVGYYTPDFWVKDLNCYFEVKGFFRDENSKQKFTEFSLQFNIILADKSYFNNLGYKIKKGLLIREF